MGSLKGEVLRVELVREGAREPSYETDGAVGMDLRASLDKDVKINSFCRSLVPTGIKIAVPLGYEAQIRPRSGLAYRHGVTVINSPGTIDPDYRGEVMVALVNLGDKPFRVVDGMRIAQLVLSPVALAAVLVVDRLDETIRGEGGFGHTGLM